MSQAGLGEPGELHRLKRSLYQEILELVMLPSAEQLQGDAAFNLQQDSAPGHTDNSTRSCFQDPEPELV